MATLLKDLYSPAFYDRFLGIAPTAVPLLQPEQFRRSLFTPEWQDMALKQRMRHTATVLHQFLPDNFESAALELEALVTGLQDASFFGAALEFMFLPDYIEQYGLDHPDAALRAFEIITPYTSCEFAIRPFIKRFPEKVFQKLTWWSKHPNHHVRRLASEGCRPRLPWAMALPDLKKDPSPVINILENLKQDSSEYVRRSVANNLNDIAKDHPEIVMEIAANWKDLSAETNNIIKHGCRSLLKQGHRAALAHYGLSPTRIAVPSFRIKAGRLRVGDRLQMEFSVENLAASARLFRMEYAIFFRHKNGRHYRKVFKISERVVEGKTSLTLQKSHDLKPITTRKYYPGTHRVALILNGKEMAVLPFELQLKK
ncbi:hypothetical protein [Flavihumibacter petaseus]|uniref:DNA alkylation repair enzyme n=1 Tax=Flavihumibacter petaseus NBRC 106054 TaxID=1220578 RepID=A0A0E9N4J9_9BACT|nr:hypothetical protein [Flavihumibacter petaseus]GAO44596.1 hypothetical protein FPE01S_03_06340 [Flavihumibacter petaseus NBRC 106054]